MLHANASSERKQLIEKFSTKIFYSDRYYDEENEYRHVILPKEIAELLPTPMKLFSELECQSFGITQSPGWQHYVIHEPEPHILLFRRKTDSRR